MNINQYFESLNENVKSCYALAEQARQRGIDPVSSIEVPQATSLAERAVGLISAVYPQIADPRLVKRILDLEKQYGSLDPAVALRVAEEVAKETYCKFASHLEAIEAGIRIAIAYLTLGVVSSPIEGFVQLKLKKTMDGKDYFAPYFSGPIRSAGGTEAAFSLVVIDHLREIFGYARYDPTQEEVKRGIHECYEYHERINNLQYLPSEQEIEELMKYLPVQLTGDPSEDREVYNYKDLPRIETNYIRSGFALVMGEGIAQKAPKILARVIKLKEKGFLLSDWGWLEGFVAMQKKIKENKAVGAGASATYIKDLVAGRPVFAHPSYSGAFRLRYGRARNTGYSTLAVHPATMVLSDNFIAVGTQLKIEKPTKGCTIAVCDSIDGPIIKLLDGSVHYVSTSDEAKQFAPELAEIIYLGDILVPYGDYRNRNHLLDKPGYVEQYWLEQLIKAGGTSELVPSLDNSIELSKKYSIALHPSYTFYWSQIDRDDFMALIDWISRGTYTSRFVLPFTKVDRERFARGKRVLELIGCPHEVSLENVIISEISARALLFNLGIATYDSLEQSFEKLISQIPAEVDVLSIINTLSLIPIKDKAGTFIGARMGRPEKAKLRKLTGSPHVLFPVGTEGGRLRSVQAAVEVGTVRSDFPLYHCTTCNVQKIYPVCDQCHETCKKKLYCPQCDRLYDSVCIEHNKGIPFSKQRVDIKTFFEKAKQLTGVRIEEIPAAVKGVRGTSSADHSCEHLGKGLLRAKYNLHVNKDGTIRYDMTEMPITHFKPKEVGTSVETLLKMGYEKDLNGKPLENDNQVLEIFPHDIILPACPESPDERADTVFLNITKFVDDELDRLYNLPRFFNLAKKEDLVGQLLGCIAPHNCAAVVGRIIGFSKVQALLASPYIHAAMRRDCDGDEAAVMLLMDLLINFSRKFLPSHRGGTQDAPLVLNTRMRAGEVDDMIFDLDVSKTVPLALYEAAELEQSPMTLKMEQVRGRIGGEHEFDNVNYFYEVSNINGGPLCSSYKTLPTMQDKVNSQMRLCSKIRAVDLTDVARLTIERHFMRDIRGNLRKFSMQAFRCVECNESFRRVPLSGKCSACGGKLIFTISEGSIIKYLASALNLARTYNVSPYLLECLEITEKDIQGIFGKEKEKQEALKRWF